MSKGGLERVKEWREANTEQARINGRKGQLRRFGLTLESYNVLLELQNSVCAICSKKEIAVQPQTGITRRLAVDHNHDTRKIRGLALYEM